MPLPQETLSNSMIPSNIIHPGQGGGGWFWKSNEGEIFTLLRGGEVGGADQHHQEPGGDQV